MITKQLSMAFPVDPEEWVSKQKHALDALSKDLFKKMHEEALFYVKTPFKLFLFGHQHSQASASILTDMGVIAAYSKRQYQWLMKNRTSTQEPIDINKSDASALSFEESLFKLVLDSEKPESLLCSYIQNGIRSQDFLHGSSLALNFLLACLYIKGEKLTSIDSHAEKLFPGKQVRQQIQGLMTGNNNQIVITYQGKKSYCPFFKNHKLLIINCPFNSQQQKYKELRQEYLQVLQKIRPLWHCSSIQKQKLVESLSDEERMVLECQEREKERIRAFQKYMMMGQEIELQDIKKLFKEQDKDDDRLVNPPESLLSIREFLLKQCKMVKRVNKSNVLIGLSHKSKAANLMQKVVKQFFRKDGELIVDRSQHHVLLTESSAGPAILLLSDDQDMI